MSIYDNVVIFLYVSQILELFTSCYKNTNDIKQIKKNITEWCKTCDLYELEIFNLYFDLIFKMWNAQGKLVYVCIFIL